MNSDQKTTLKQLFENSEPDIKRDLRAQRLESDGAGMTSETIVRDFQTAIDSMFGRDDLAHDLARLAKPVYVANNVSIGYVTEEPQPVVAFDWTLEGSQSTTATYQLVGLTNHPKSQRAGAGGGRRAMLNLGLALAACGRSLNDVIVYGGGRGRPTRLSHFDYTALDECSLFDKDLSAHPGERHRQLSRKLTSSRSRAGKAARWAS